MSWSIDVHTILIGAAVPIGVVAERNKHKVGWAYSILPEEIKERLRNIKSDDLQNVRISDWLGDNPPTTRVFRLK